MPVHIIGVDDLKEYILGVMRRAEHHAQDVDEVCLSVAGAIVWRGDRIDVIQRQGEMGNVLWMYIGDNKYAFSFNHATGQIEVRQGSLQGKLAAIYKALHRTPPCRARAPLLTGGYMRLCATH